MNEDFKINNIDKWTVKPNEDGYTSPIAMIVEDVNIKIENDIIKAVQNYDIKVDRDQYSKGYAAARKEFEPHWIPITFRPFTEEELRDYCEKWSVKPEDVTDREGWVYNCPLPDDGEEVLITTKVWGYVKIDTFHADPDGFYFEDHEDPDEVAAWMRLPEPFGGEQDEQK